jgi:hypothetical protein
LAIDAVNAEAAAVADFRVIIVLDVHVADDVAVDVVEAQLIGR